MVLVFHDSLETLCNEQLNVIARERERERERERKREREKEREREREREKEREREREREREIVQLYTCNYFTFVSISCTVKSKKIKF